MAFAITGNIPSGSIEVCAATEPGDIRLKLKTDTGTNFIGYYHFRASGVRGLRCRYAILNAGHSAYDRLAGRDDYEDEWTNTGPHASYDLETWFRIPAQIIDGAYVFEHVPEYDVCYYAKWAPYPLERELRYYARLQRSPRVRIEPVATSVEGRTLDLLTLGEPAHGRKVCWILSRQHPSETMGGYFLEGFFDRMTDPHDAVAASLLQQAVFYIVPNMNPDGTAHGYTRANGAGTNLNREWLAPSLAASPEVYRVRERMEATGVDFCMDCHGDEELRCNFLGGPLEIPSRSEALTAKFKAFERAWAAASPEYEMGHPYPGGAPAAADLRMAWNWIGERYNCLSILLEQPFKDTRWRTDPQHGWSPQRANAFGASLVTALQATVATLR